MDLTLLVANYNTPDLIINLLRSVKTTQIELPKIVVIDTSTEESNKLDDYDIPYYRARGLTHGEAINLGLSKIKTKYVMLVDSDIIFYKDITPLLKIFQDNNLTLMGKVVGDTAGKQLYPRVEPWCCFMNHEVLNHSKIKFFDRVRSIKTDKCKVYDIGSTMYEDIVNCGLFVGDIEIEGKYFKHYGGMSWRSQKYNPNDVDTDIDFGGTHPNKALFDYAQHIKISYDKETQCLNHIDIKGAFV